MIRKFTGFFGGRQTANGEHSPQQDNPALAQQKSLNLKLLSRLRRKKIPTLRQLKHLLKVLSPRERFTVVILLGVIAVAGITGGGMFYLQHFIPQPAIGGEYSEGLIGAPQYINPLLSQTNDVDTDLQRLVFAGLVKYDHDLQLVPDLAEGWEVSDDLKTFTFRLKEGVRWHDGQPLTADDVIFTIHSIQDPDFKSPLLISVRGVAVSKIDERTVVFVLPDAFPEFLEVLTVGLLPEHIWGSIPPINANLTEYNLKPVGAGAWQFRSLAKDRLGNIKSITLVPNPHYPGTRPYLQKLTFKFYPNFQTGVSALKNHSVDGLSFLPKELKAEIQGNRGLKLHSFHLPQFTAIFFNQRENEALKDKRVRQALSLAINKPDILTRALQLEGEMIDGPILPGAIGYDSALTTVGYDPGKADELLAQAGWKKITAQEYQELLLAKAAAVAAAAAQDAENTESVELLPSPTSTPMVPNVALEAGQETYRQSGEQILEIGLTTVSQPENMAAAELVKTAWEAIGVRVNLTIVEANRITREIIKPRDYQSLLYGAIVGPDSDPYPFWHSSQVQDPGLNLALFSNRRADKLLEEAHSTLDTELRHEKLREFQQVVTEEFPAVFLYSPTYTYVIDEKIKGVGVERVLIPADRFNNLADWYTATKRTYVKP